MKLYMLVIIDEDGNPKVHSVHQADQKAREAAAPFKQDREKTRPMIQQLEIDESTSCGHDNWNDYFERCDDCGMTHDQIVDQQQEGI